MTLFPKNCSGESRAKNTQILLGLQKLEELQNDVAVVYLLPDLSSWKPKHTALLSFGLVFV